MYVYTDIAQNELICGYANVMHTSSSFHSHTQTHTRMHTHTHTHTHTLSHSHILTPFEDRKLTGAKSGHCPRFHTDMDTKMDNGQ